MSLPSFVTSTKVQRCDIFTDIPLFAFHLCLLITSVSYFLYCLERIYLAQKTNALCCLLCCPALRVVASPLFRFAELKSACLLGCLFLLYTKQGQTNGLGRLLILIEVLLLCLCTGGSWIYNGKWSESNGNRNVFRFGQQ